MGEKFEVGYVAQNEKGRYLNIAFGQDEIVIGEYQDIKMATVFEFADDIEADLVFDSGTNPKWVNKVDESYNIVAKVHIDNLYDAVMNDDF